MKKKISISIVSYTNTLPFRYGLQKYFSDEEIDLQLDIPSICAKKILEKKVDIGLIPSAILAKNGDLKIISRYCIGANGKVDSVMLYSQKPINELENVILDYQSRTSVELVKILCKEWWKINPNFIPATENFISEIRGNTGAVVIGDRTFGCKGKFAFEYDLSENWSHLTRLPFVFACWVSHEEIPKEFLNKFNEALSFGITNILESIKTDPPKYLSTNECLIYLSERISYNLNDKKNKALDLFISKLKK